MAEGKSNSVTNTLKTAWNGAKAAPTPTKVGAGTVAGLLAIGTFVLGRATKKGKK